MRTHFRELVRSGTYRLLRWGIKPPTDAFSTVVEVTRLRECLEELSINCVLDVGANEGQFATRLRRLGFSGWIISFEPHPTAFARLQDRHGDDPKWRGCQFALGSVRETKPFYLHADSSFSSFLRPLEDEPTQTSVEDVEVQTLSDVLDGLLAKISEPRIMLKMDTQGWDLEVLRGATSVLPRVDALLSELSVQPLYDGMTPIEGALSFYRELGFQLYDITPINRRPDGTVVECDCLLVRPGAHR